MDIMNIIREVCETGLSQRIPYTPANKKACWEVYKAPRRNGRNPLGIKTIYKPFTKEPEFLEIRVLAKEPQRVPPEIKAQILAMEINEEIAFPLEEVQRATRYARSKKMCLLEKPSLRTKEARVYYLESLKTATNENL